MDDRLADAAPAAACRLLLVHAHPDDETITTGATIAHYAAQGVHVTVLTCTLGEQGEILVPELEGLEAARADQLGGYRIGELRAAVDALGATQHFFLGGAGRFRDSGMRGTPSADHPRAFVRAETDPEVFAEAVNEAVAVLRDVRPQVVITYDENGDYGHPDHVLAHRVTMAAVDAAADPERGAGEPWRVTKVYWTATTRSAQQRDFEAVSAATDHGFAAVGPEELGYGVADAVVTTVVDAPDAVPAKTAALQAHETQVLVDGPLYALSNRQGRLISGVESYRLVRGAAGGELDASGRERDVFGGITS